MMANYYHGLLNDPLKAIGLTKFQSVLFHESCSLVLYQLHVSVPQGLNFFTKLFCFLYFFFARLSVEVAICLFLCFSIN